ncbi:MAG: (Fe-S)-binding protein [bacterium]
MRTKEQPKYSYILEPIELEERPKRFLDAFAAILRYSNYAPVLDAYLRIRAKCSICTVDCQVYQASGDPQDIPCLRSELLLSVYRRYFTLTGLLKAPLFDDFRLTDEYIDRMAEAYYRCTACKRCKYSCPLGIDLYPSAGITFPIDVEGAEYVFFPAVSDYLLEADTLMGNAAMLHAVGASWTIGTGNFDGIDYGLFYSDRMWERIIKKQVAEIHRLKGRKMLIGECGHASRAAKEGMNNFIPEKDRVPVVNIVEFAFEQFKSGRLKLIPDAIAEPTTYHDPCNISRKGWIVDQPRTLLRHICREFIEMRPGGADNYCCGGGGGTVSIDEIRKFRTSIGGATKAEQLRSTGAKIVVAPCANCKKQLDEVIADHKIDIERKGLHDLLLKAIIMPDGQKPVVKTDGEEF